MLSDAVFYFIKIHAYRSEPLFGVIANNRTELNELGRVAADEWIQLFNKSNGIELDCWLLFPDRLEGILSVEDPLVSRGYAARNEKPRLLSSFVASYKAAAATRINLIRNNPGGLVWQRGYQERRLTDTTTLNRVRQLLLR